MFGSSCTPAASSTSTIEPRASASMRRSATVTSSVPLASIAAAIASSERKPPVPSSSREPSSRPAIVSGSVCTRRRDAHSLQPPWIARRTSTRAPSSSSVVSHSPARHDLGVDRDGHAPRAAGDVERVEQRAHGRAGRQLARLAVEQDRHAGTPREAARDRRRPPTRAAARRTARRRPARRSGRRAGSRCGSGRSPRPGRRACRRRSPAGCRASRAAARRAAPPAPARARPARPRRCRAAARTRRRRSARCRSRAPPSSRRARSARPRAGRGRRRASRIVRSTRPGPCGSRRRSTWPLTGRTGTQRRWQPSSRRGAPAATRTAPAATTDPSSADARPLAAARTRVTRAPVRMAPPARAHRLGQRGHEPARIDRVVARDVEREPDGRRERRLGAPRGRRQEPLDVEPDRAAGTRAGGRAPPPRRGRARRRACRSARSPGSAPDASASSAQNAGNTAAARRLSSSSASSPKLRLGHRREHAGGDVPGARLAGVEHADAQAALGGAPRARQPDRPAADDGDVRLGLLHRHFELDSFPTPVRPGSGSTVGAPMAPSQPVCGLPYAQSVARSACLTTR